jgi:hypothetical protein
MNPTLGQLPPSQIKSESEFHAFAENEIVPCVGRLEYAEELSPEILRRVAEKGYLGLTLRAN